MSIHAHLLWAHSHDVWQYLSSSKNSWRYILLKITLSTCCDFNGVFQVSYDWQLRQSAPGKVTCLNNCALRHKRNTHIEQTTQYENPCLLPFLTMWLPASTRIKWHPRTFGLIRIQMKTSTHWGNFYFNSTFSLGYGNSLGLNNEKCWKYVVYVTLKLKMNWNNFC